MIVSMDEFNYNYIWAALVVNLAFVYILPRIIKKPTGVKIIDDVILYLNSQKDFLLSSSIIVALVTYISLYWVESQEGISPPKSPDF